MKSSAILTAVLLAFLWALPAYADWVRGETGMSRLPQEVRDRLINTPLDLSYAMKHGTLPKDRKPVTKTDFPAHWNWHDMDGVDWMTPVRNQGGCGSCWTFGALGAMEGLINIYKEDPDFDYDLSEQFMVACGGGSCDGGGFAEEVLGYIEKNGIPDEICYPYLAEEGLCEDACDDYLTRIVKLSDWSIMLTPTEEELKEELMKGPLTVTMRAENDLYYYRSGVYYGFTEACSLTHLAPNHIVTLVGWDDEHDSWIARNSWGADWGMDGYFEIKRGTSCFAVITADWLRIDPETVPDEPLNIGLCQPETLEKVLEPGSVVDTVQFDLNLENCGDLDISWTLREDITWKGWVTVTPTEGHLDVGESENVNFTVDIAGHAPGLIEQPFVIMPSNGPLITVNLKIEIQSEEPEGDGDEELEAEAAEEPLEDGDEAVEDEGSGSGSDGCSSSSMPSALLMLLAGTLLAYRRREDEVR